MGSETPGVPVLAELDEDGVEHRVREQLHRQRQLFDSSPDGIVVCDGAGRILLANQRLEDLLGYPHGSLVGQSLEVLIPDERRERHEQHRRTFVSGPRARPMGPALELAARHADGSEIPVEISLAPLLFEGESVTMATVRDSRERLAHLHRLRDAEQRLLLADERERIARDLHDIVIQRLFATGLGVQSVAMRVDPSLRPRLEDAVNAIDDAIRDIRSAIFQLSQAGPLRSGVRAGLFDIAAEAERLLGFLPRVHVDGPVDSRIDGEFAAEVLGVVRELVSNAVRHAHATELLIAIVVDQDLVRCTVSDNGIGRLDLDSPRAGRGLANLGERARRHGGTFELLDRPSGGLDASWTARLP